MDTNQKIDLYIKRRNKLTSRRDGLIDSKTIAYIDARLSELSIAGQRNDVDLLLGRPCAVLPDRGALFAASMSPELAADVEAVREGWAVNQAIATEQAAPVAQARVDKFQEFVDQTNDYVIHMLEIYGAEMHDTPKDWRDLRGDLDI